MASVSAFDSRPLPPPVEQAACPSPRVLICIPHLTGGGAERQVRMLAPRLVRLGIRLSIFGRLSEGEAEMLRHEGVDCHENIREGNHNPLLALDLERAARRSRAEVIHSWLTQMDILGGAVALATRRRWILSERSSAGGYGNGVKDRLRGQLGRLADIVVANSESGLELWPGHRNSLVIPNGVDHDAIRRVPAEGRERPTIVSAARLIATKRVDRLIHALARIRREVANIQLVLLGEGPEETSLRSLASQLGVDDHVHFAGYRPDAWSWIKGATVYVSASQVEGQPNAILEAAAAERPLALSDTRTHRDTVGDEGAVFFHPEDGDALAAAVVGLIANPAAARSLAAAARDAVAGLSADRSAELYARLYRSAVSGAAFERVARLKRARPVTS